MSKKILARSDPPKPEKMIPTALFFFLPNFFLQNKFADYKLIFLSRDEGFSFWIRNWYTHYFSEIIFEIFLTLNFINIRQIDNPNLNLILFYQLNDNFENLLCIEMPLQKSIREWIMWLRLIQGLYTTFQIV